jgi:hypothetical protein
MSLVAFIAVGMHEAHPCAIDEIIVLRKKTHVTKGEEPGMLHYDGFSYCALFQNKLRLDWVAEAVAHNGQLKNLALNSPLVFVQKWFWS